jgi:hypothetical protein
MRFVNPDCTAPARDHRAGHVCPLPLRKERQLRGARDHLTARDEGVGAEDSGRKKVMSANIKKPTQKKSELTKNKVKHTAAAIFIL